ncbi:hypothetical protein V5F34_02930 [Xanthobacter autotrophicus]|uniref:hypothetical protein n=1 Tax=Xanthobacter autotrophicus TaxID=280 RepID=UPI0037270976
MSVMKFAIPAAAAALIALSGASQAQTSGTAASPNTQHGPAQEGGRTQATPGVTGGSIPLPEAGIPPTPRSGIAPGPNTHAGPAQEGGRTQATPGTSSAPGTPTVDTTGSVTPRSGTAPGPNTQHGPAQEGGRTQATPGVSR